MIYGDYSTDTCILRWIDYELVLLDMIPAAGLKWRGNSNELIASYAVSLHEVLAICVITNM